MKEVMEPAYRFLPLHHVTPVRELLELPSPGMHHIVPPAIAAPEIVEEVTHVSPLLAPRVCALCGAIMATTPIPDSPLRMAMDLDTPAPVYMPMPDTPLGVTIIHRPPTPPIEAHDSWCACSPCLVAQDELYRT